MKRLATMFLAFSLVLALSASVLATNGDRTATLSFRDIKITLNGKEIQTKAEPFIIDGTTYLPVRAVSEALGLNVEWDGETHTVILTDQSYSGSNPSTTANSAPDVSVESYSCEASYGGTTYYALVATNNTAGTVRIDANVVEKDASGKIISAKDGFDTGVASGESLCLIFYFDGYNASNTFEPKVTVSPSTTKSFFREISVDYSIAGNNVILSAINTSNEDVDSIEAKALFFKNGKLVGTDSTSWEMKAHDTTVKQLDYSRDFDDVKLFVHSVNYW